MRSLANKNILVTGAAGFIGSHLCDQLIKSSGCNTLIGIDNLYLGNKSNLRDCSQSHKFTFIPGDCSKLTTLRELLFERKINIVFNLATYPINLSFIDPVLTCINSINISLNLCELLREGLYETLCNFSTSEVYGDFIGIPFSEESPLVPLTAYAAGKASADHILNSYVKSFGIDAFTVRPFNNYGPRQSTSPRLAGLVPNTINRIRNGQKPIIEGTGHQKREYVYVRDTIDIALRLYLTLEAGETVDISCKNRFSVMEVVRDISMLMNYNGGIEYRESRPVDAKDHQSYSGKLESMINYEFTSFRAGLISTINYYQKLDNEDS